MKQKLTMKMKQMLAMIAVLVCCFVVLLFGWATESRDGETQTANSPESAKEEISEASTKNSTSTVSEPTKDEGTKLNYYNDTSEITGENGERTKEQRRLAAIKAVNDQVVLTAENNTDFAALLQLKDPADPSVEEFSLNYYGWTVEFDGNIANVANFEDFKNYYDILAGAGDFSENEAFGPYFRFSNIGSREYPDAVMQGANVRIKATIGAFSEKTQWFVLVPISITAR